MANKADSVSDATWTTVQNGMARVISEGAISMLTNRLPVKVCGKSGTAQEDKKEVTTHVMSCSHRMTKDRLR